MKIIHCLNHFFPEQIAGTEVYVWKLCKHLQALGCHVSVVLPNYDSKDSVSYVYDDLPVYKYAEPSQHTREIVTGKRLPEGLQHFAAYLKKEQPDVVHFHEISGSIGIGVKHFEIAKQVGARVFFTMHLAGNTCRTGTLMYAGKELCDGLISEERCSYCALVQKTGSTTKAHLISKISRPFSALDIETSNWQNAVGTALSYPSQVKTLKKNLKRIVQACDKIIPITNWYYQILVKNGVPVNKLNLVLQALPILPNGTYIKPAKSTKIKRLIFVGRIHWLKGMDLMLEAFKHIPKNELQLDIYGSASEPGYLEACKKATLAFPNISWKGSIQPELVVDTMRNYDALILPSMFSEMSPLVVQEAFAAGIPVIGSNVYGIAEQVQNNQNGLLFEFGNKSALLKVLQRVIDDNGLLQGLAPGRDKPRGFLEVANETMSLYKESIIGQ